MNQQIIECPYCGALNPLPTINKSTTHSFSITIYKYTRSSEQKSPTTEIKCVYCSRHYVYIPMNDFSWIKTHLQISDVVLQTFKIYFPQENLDALFSNIVCLTKPKQKFGFIKHIHICFIIKGTRAYIDCTQTKDKLLSINIIKV